MALASTAKAAETTAEKKQMTRTATSGPGGAHIPGWVAAGGTSGNAAKFPIMASNHQQSMMLQSELFERSMQEQKLWQQHAIASAGKTKSSPAREDKNRQHLPLPTPRPTPPTPMARSRNGGRSEGGSEGGSISSQETMMQIQHLQQQQAIASVGKTEVLPATEDRKRQHLQPPPPSQMARIRRGSRGKGGSDGGFIFSHETPTLHSSSAFVDRDRNMDGCDDFDHGDRESRLCQPDHNRRSFQRGDALPLPSHWLEWQQMMMTTQVVLASSESLPLMVLHEPGESPIFGDSSYDKSEVDHGQVDDDYLSDIDTSVEDKEDDQGEDDGDPLPLLLGGKCTTFTAQEESECVGEIFGKEEYAGVGRCRRRCRQAVGVGLEVIWPQEDSMTNYDGVMLAAEVLAKELFLIDKFLIDKDEQLKLSKAKSNGLKLAVHELTIDNANNANELDNRMSSLQAIELNGILQARVNQVSAVNYELGEVTINESLTKSLNDELSRDKKEIEEMTKNEDAGVIAVRGGLWVVHPQEDSTTKEGGGEAAMATGMASGVKGDNVNGDCCCVDEQAEVTVEWTMHSKGGDGEEPISLVDKASQEHGVEHEMTKNDKDEDHHPKWTPEKTPVKSSPLVFEIPDDDDSEASFVVLMRYMGCSTRNQNSRDFSFDSYDESVSWCSDEIYGDSKSEEDWTMKNNEVGIEISIQDVILASWDSPALSPDGRLVRCVKTDKTTDVRGNPNLPKATGSAKKKNVNKNNLTVDTSEETTKTISKEKGTVVGSPKLVISRTSHSDEEQITTPEARMTSTPNSPAPKSLTPVCLIHRTPAGQAAPRKYEEECMSHVSAEKRIRKPNLTTDAAEETTKTREKECSDFGSIFTTVGCLPDEEEFKKHHACVSTSKSPVPKSLTPVWSIPRTPAGQAALRKYEEGFMLHESVEKKIRKPDLTIVDSAGETKKLKKEENTIVASPGLFISPATQLLQGVSPSAKSVRSDNALIKSSECNTATISQSADRFSEAMAIVSAKKALLRKYEEEFLSTKVAGSDMKKVREPYLTVDSAGETKVKSKENLVESSWTHDKEKSTMYNS